MICASTGPYFSSNKRMCVNVAAPASKIHVQTTSSASGPAGSIDGVVLGVKSDAWIGSWRYERRTPFNHCTLDKDLSLCTVLDYYLDNVIANIPELAIFMHSKGFVRGYKLVETRQIPYMSATGRPLFDVQDVSMNASMLLKFRQEICLRQNGTYRLHRKEVETSLRLYDVDVLSRGSQLKWKYMMEMLCYRFAARDSRLWTIVASGTPQLLKQLQQRQRDLLRTCMSLLGEISQKGGAAHSSICSSVSEQLADTYLRECHQLHSFNSATTSSADSDRDASIRSLKKAKKYLLASIKLFKVCIPSDSSSVLHLAMMSQQISHLWTQIKTARWAVSWTKNKTDCS
ncbi:hypothetical protein PsorP6_006065 [Peronosclerospora sorghi]|uniref:Uncharacterized protein n=1 Tax=Peronosclerospora sorghi TaxID=230839 RepID=A0ACC0W1Y7_9STRA|nr:hypothetical protein PsorP6_006065 [Peronosclerospora sorghi]